MTNSEHPEQESYEPHQFSGESKSSLIPGLALIKNYISAEQESQILQELECRSWTRERRGLVQNYGYIFDYKSSGIGDLTRVVPIPAFLARIGDRLVSEGYFPCNPECIIVNHYEPGEGIVPHIDVIEHFGPQVVTLSLISPICMVFVNDRQRVRRMEIALPARSLLSMNGEARFEWLHGIRERKSDMIDGISVKRGRRISISFRNIKEQFRAHSDEELFADS